MIMVITLSEYKQNISVSQFINPFSAVTDIRRQNLTTLDVRFRRLQPIPARKE